MNEYITYTLDEHTLLIFSPDMKYEIYSCNSYHGIIFHIPEKDNQIFGSEGHYDIMHNNILGNRLLINNFEGWKDIPFKQSTFELLPFGIEVIEL